MEQRDLHNFIELQSDGFLTMQQRDMNNDPEQ